MKRLIIATPSAAALAVAGCHAGRALHVATAFSAHQACAQAFVIDQPVEPLIKDYIRPMVGFPVVRSAIKFTVDRSGREVRTSLAGGFRARAVYADGRGCTVVRGTDRPAPLARTAMSTEPLPVALDPALAEEVGRVFTPDRRAMLVLRAGQIVAEHYAPGYGPGTRLQSWSMAKSLTNALIGILVRQGRIAAAAQVTGLPAGVTIDTLLRQTSGQPFGSSNSGFDRASRMQFLEPDTARYAATTFTAPPGASWSYTDANYALLSGVIRRAVGGTPDAVVRFADKSLFGPAGMPSALLEFDEAGNPMGADWAYATARDWSRFGLLYMRDGMANGRRVLPPGWADYSCRWTPQSDAGYAAGFWTNRGPSAGARTRRQWGLPEDSCFALGNSGQVVLFAPSASIVIVSLGYSMDKSNRTPVEAVARLFRAATKPARSAGLERDAVAGRLTRRSFR